MKTFTCELMEPGLTSFLKVLPHLYLSLSLPPPPLSYSCIKTESLEQKFNQVGFTTSIVKYNTRELRNRKRKLSMYRFIFSTFSFPLFVNILFSEFGYQEDL